MKNIRRIKIACYTINVTMSAVANLSPVLFMTFRSLYGISYSLLGSLVLINFLTQLSVDLIFSFFSHKFNIQKVVKITPVIAFAGLLCYAAAPVIFPNSVYYGLVIGTVIFSCSSGLAEVLISPVIAALPSEDPDREMSKLHSVYAWGVVGVIIVSTVFLFLFDQQNWQYLAILFSLIPVVSFFLFRGCSLPQMKTPEKVSGVIENLKNPLLWLFVIGIFLGGAAECTMAQWCSSYLEKALGIEKLWGDIFGVALFAATLGAGRTLYANFGKNIGRVLIMGAVGATLCYFITALSSAPVVGLLACALTGFCVSMMWPGSLVAVERKFSNCGVFVFALMAAGGDLGASVGPQMVGIIADSVIKNPNAAFLADTLGLSAEQFGMKLGFLAGMQFPLAAIFIYSAVNKCIKSK